MYSGKLDLDTSLTFVHITYKQRNGKKGWTIIDGLNKALESQTSKEDLVDDDEVTKSEEEQKPEPQKITLKDVSFELKKKFSTVATITSTNGIQLNGNHKIEVKNFLVSSGLVSADQIRLHGV